MTEKKAKESRAKARKRTTASKGKASKAKKKARAKKTSKKARKKATATRKKARAKAHLRERVLEVLGSENQGLTIKALCARLDATGTAAKSVSKITKQLNKECALLVSLRDGEEVYELPTCDPAHFEEHEEADDRQLSPRSPREREDRLRHRLQDPLQRCFDCLGGFLTAVEETHDNRRLALATYKELAPLLRQARRTHSARVLGDLLPSLESKDAMVSALLDMAEDPRTAFQQLGKLKTALSDEWAAKRRRRQRKPDPSWASRAWETWQTGGYRKKADLAKELRIDEKELSRVLERFRKRESRRL